MATITLTIPNTQVTRVQDAICAANNYQSIINGVPNPISKTEFTRQWLGTQLKNAVKDWEGIAAAKTASETAKADAETNITIT